MSPTLREQGIETVHDQVVSLVAQRWAKAFVCKVTIKSGLEQNPWAEPNQSCDIVGWYVSSGGNTMVGNSCASVCVRSMTRTSPLDTARAKERRSIDAMFNLSSHARALWD